ncbi:hypothetical protein [Ferrimonas aestuarii]|uniref:Uncharacterized protein n=1 Tax=Ferrimonas aestuarii TaxID=2569539 RepID=A0A4U1BL63_9GAMM|nr:hypothetical protein [Ferrimonas aestuarii]TKB53294.1 hypothetical protein FCL42_14575 [Ferrimonas aestuarii]
MSLTPVQSNTVAIAVATTVISALLVWCGTALQSSQVELGKLQVQVEQLRTELNAAASTSVQREHRLTRLERTVAVLEARQ